MVERAELDDLIQRLYDKRQIAIQELLSFDDYQPDDVADIEFASQEVDLLTGVLQAVVWSLPEYRFDLIAEPPWPWCKRVKAVSFFEARRMAQQALECKETGRFELEREVAFVRRAR